MSRVAQEGRTPFVVLAEDNFHPKSVKSTSDPQWQDKFERLYDTASLQATSFYAVAGNHDHRGNIDAQLAYAMVKLGSHAGRGMSFITPGISAKPVTWSCCAWFFSTL